MKCSRIISLFSLAITPLVHIKTTSQQPPELNLYAFYSDSHKILKDEWFLPSLNKLNDNIKLHLLHVQQKGNGVWGTRPFKQIMLDKVNMIIGAIKENWGGVFVYADTDIQFFRPFNAYIRSLLENYDMVIARDNPKGVCCAGFFACKGNAKMLNLWAQIKRFMLNNKDADDQSPLNSFLRNKRLNIKWNYLPTAFYGGATITGNTRWLPTMNIPVPENIILHHANGTIGLENKISQLRQIQEKFSILQSEALTN